jgi:integrase
VWRSGIVELDSTLLIATGLRRSELLGLRWTDIDEKAGMLTATGKVIRVTGQGLMRLDETKSTAGRRILPLPKFAIAMLQKRTHLPYFGEQTVISPLRQARCATRTISRRNGGPPGKSSVSATRLSRAPWRRQPWPHRASTAPSHCLIDRRSCDSSNAARAHWTPNVWAPS